MKTNGVIIRLFCLLLALCTLCVAFASCANEEVEGALTSSSADGTKETEETTGGARTDEDGYLILESIPENFKINGIMKVLGWGDGKQHYRDELGTDVIGNAIYKRCMTVEENLNVDLQWTFVPGKWEYKLDFAQEINRTSSSGMAYDATVCYNLVPYVLAVQGLAENLYNTKYIDLTAPWWPSAYTNEALYNETIFGLVESCAYATLRQMTGIFFNNELIEKKSLESPYDMVAANEWTLDNMMTMIKGTYEDLNSNGQKDINDLFGASTGNAAQIDSWFYGTGYRWSDFDGEGNLKLLAGDPSIIEFTNRMAEAFGQLDFRAVDSKHGNLFIEERAVLYLASVTLAETSLKDLEINYGIAPIPKGEKAQERYYTHLSNTHDAWCIPLNAKDIDVSSAVIESMAYESYRSVEDVYYDTCIKLRYAPDERLGEMYDLIRESITFDFFYLFGGTFKVFPITPMRDSCQNPLQHSWSNTWEKNKTMWEGEFESIVDLYNGTVK